MFQRLAPKLFIATLLSTSVLTAVAQTHSSGVPDVAGLSCDSETIVRLQNYVTSTEVQKPSKGREFEIKKVGDQYKLVLYFPKDDPAIRKALQEKLNQFQSACNNQILNEKLGKRPEISPDTPRSLSDALPKMNVEVPEIRKSGQFSLDINPDGTPGGGRSQERLSAEIPINHTEYERILNQKSLPVDGATVRFKLGW